MKTEAFIHAELSRAEANLRADIKAYVATLDQKISKLSERVAFLEDLVVVVDVEEGVPPKTSA
jgi:uncharacterized protein YceH (UPF0502 family)